MTGKIESGQLVTVEPIKEIEVDDIVLCKVRGKEYLHIVKAKDKDRYLIGNNRGVTNGWIGRNAIFGKLVKIEP
jgi:SOS-response transcriptional repressor LexA